MKTHKNKQWYLVSYDVRDPKRLRQTAKCLEGYGVRLQYSLFRCHLTKRGIERLRWELSRIRSPEDSILLIGLCPSCAARINQRNQQEVLPEQDETFQIV